MAIARPMLLTGKERSEAESIIREHHYTHSVPSGKSYYVQYGEALVVWSIPANKNLSKFVLGFPGVLWELSRLWAPDGHARDLLTRAISAAVGVLGSLERPDAVVSYADPNVGHRGFVYKAASWTHHGTSEEVRAYRDGTGRVIARRAFHSGRRGMRKAEIEALGYSELKLSGKERFVRLLSNRAKSFAKKTAPTKE